MKAAAVTPAVSAAAGFATIRDGTRSIALEYQWVGNQRHDAPLMVFLHEGLGSVAMWKDYPGTLCAATGMRGLVFSREGYGRSTPRPADKKWPIEFMQRQAAELLPALFRELAIESAPWLFGHSDGASIALLYAAAYPDAVAGVIAVAPHIMVEDVTIASIEIARTMYRTTDLRVRLARYHDDPDSAFWGWNDVWLDPLFRSWNIEDRLGHIRCPVLAVQGENDEYGSMAQIDGITRLLAQARAVKLPACGHSPHRDQPAALTAAVTAFMHEPRRANAAPARASSA